MIFELLYVVLCAFLSATMVLLVFYRGFGMYHIVFPVVFFKWCISAVWLFGLVWFLLDDLYYSSLTFYHAQSFIFARHFSASTRPRGSIIRKTKNLPWPYLPGSFEYAVLLGIMASDGYLGLKPNTINSSAYFSLHMAVPDYMRWVCHNLLSEIFTPNGDLTPKPRLNPTSWQRNSRIYEFLAGMHAQWYVPHPSPVTGTKHNKLWLKVLPLDVLTKYFDAVSLAHMIMCDGYYKGMDFCYYVCLDSFSYDQLVLFANFLSTKFGLHCAVNVNTNVDGVKTYRLRFYKQDSAKIAALIYPHLHPDFYYKLPVGFVPSAVLQTAVKPVNPVAIVALPALPDLPALDSISSSLGTALSDVSILNSLVLTSALFGALVLAHILSAS